MARQKSVITRLDALKARIASATKGPWVRDADYVVGQVSGGRPNGEVIAICQPSVDRLRVPNVENADFIAHAREDIERLVAVVEAARSVITLSQIQLSLTPEVRQFRDALAYWLAEEEQVVKP